MNPSTSLPTGSPVLLAKRKRGRPKSIAGEFAHECARSGIGPDQSTCQRTKLDHAHRQAFFGVILRATPEIQTRIMGAPWRELRAFPRGIRVAATEIGRWLQENKFADAAEGAALDVVVDARGLGMSWRDIGIHFRKVRLGQREGNAQALAVYLAAAFDDYCRRFPATSREARLQAIGHLLSIAEDRE